MRRRLALRSATTSLGFVPAFVGVYVAAKMYEYLTVSTMFVLVGQTSLREPIINTWCLGILLASYVPWVFALSRGWVTGATGGGFVIAAYAFGLRLIAEWPYAWAQMPWHELPPPEPYGTILLVSRAVGLIGMALGLAFVAAAVTSERYLRRRAPDWAVTE